MKDAETVTWSGSLSCSGIGNINLAGCGFRFLVGVNLLLVTEMSPDAGRLRLGRSPATNPCALVDGLNPHAISQLGV